MALLCRVWLPGAAGGRWERAPLFASSGGPRDQAACPIWQAPRGTHRVCHQQFHHCHLVFIMISTIIDDMLSTAASPDLPRMGGLAAPCEHALRPLSRLARRSLAARGWRAPAGRRGLGLRRMRGPCPGRPLAPRIDSDFAPPFPTANELAPGLYRIAIRIAIRFLALPGAIIR